MRVVAAPSFQAIQLAQQLSTRLHAYVEEHEDFFMHDLIRPHLATLCSFLCRLQARPSVSRDGPFGKRRKARCDPALRLVQIDETAKLRIGELRASFSRHVAAADIATKLFSTEADGYYKSSTFEVPKLSEISTGDDEIHRLRGLISTLISQRHDLAKMHTSVEVGIFSVRAAQLRKALLPAPMRSLGRLYLFLPEVAIALVRQLHLEVSQLATRLMAPVNSVEDFVSLTESLNFAGVTLPSYTTRYTRIDELFCLIREIGISLTSDATSELALLENAISTLRSSVADAEGAQSDRLAEWKDRVEALVDELRFKASAVLASHRPSRL
eukprot:4261460-Pleurochrysis_carterae.AAC.1